MNFLYRLARPALFHMDAETAHNVTIGALKSGILSTPAPAYPTLSKRVMGLDFPNPVGLAAGFDKNAEVIAPMLKLGFGFVEVGTVTPKPQGGNPRPRVFRDPPHDAVINRMGFPNKGLEAFKDNLTDFRQSERGDPSIVGVNIGMNKEQTEPAEDYTLLIRELAPLASYLSVNISSPNTPGLRDLQAKETLGPLLDTLIRVRNETVQSAPPPLLVKLAPDLDETQQADTAEVLKNSGVDGVILTNTTLARPDYLSADFKDQTGGLSGAPLRDPSTEIIKRFAELMGGKLPIIGAGGVASSIDAQEKFNAGAGLVQLYSGLIYQGPDLPKDICKGLTKAA